MALSILFTLVPCNLNVPIVLNVHVNEKKKIYFFYKDFF